VTALDWIIVALTVMTAFAGFFQGFVVGAATLAGFAGGLFAGARLGQSLVAAGSESPYAPLFGLTGAVLGGLLLGSVFEALGHGLRRRLGSAAPPLALADGMAGAVLSTVVALGLVWLAGAVLLQAPQAAGLRADIQRSAILRALNGTLPPSAPVLNALARFDPFPRINGPAIDVAAPRAAIARDPQVRDAGASVVRVRGTACGLGIEGSGWVAGPGVVVTNAHVVAGQDDSTVQARGTGPSLDAHAVVFDPRDDIAVLRVPGLDAPSLALASAPRSGVSGAILGFPENGPYDVRAGRLGATRSVVTQDAYGRGPVRREVAGLRGTVRPGNSGGPVVDGRGRVLTTVFAATRGGAERGGYGVPNAVVRRDLEQAGGDVDTGPCAR
jgi:S1-C subfamily serine protease